ncbi:hypothetical protein A0123_00094 [Gluconobacter cerinus]|uniref:HNH endonuclease n=2 Tax=Gluconobacter cerinus TaxID=38307 RepID=A0A1B6VPZ8_9PROT|nr:hypothetical protein A0123_00094 [Gluconobacter cerinus]
MPKGHKKPRAPVRGSQEAGSWTLQLSGVHGAGRFLHIAAPDHANLMQMSDEGKRIYVITDRSGHHTAVMLTKAPQTPGSHQMVTVARFLAGEMHDGRKLHYKDGNPFNLHRDNLETEIKATSERHPINWEKAVAGRAVFLSLVQSHSEHPLTA